MASHKLERDLTAASVGFLSKEDYKRKREELEHESALNALKRIAGDNGDKKEEMEPGSDA